MSDNGQTPQIVVDAQDERTIVPFEFVKDGRIVLNISYAATQDLVLGNDAIEFQARFGGNPFNVSVPVGAVLAIYARETGEGMVFAETPEPGDAAVADAEDDSAAAEAEPGRPGKSGRSHLRVIK